MHSDTQSRPIRVKFIGTYGDDIWLRQFPGNQPLWGRCEFTLAPENDDYDWLVVYNDLPPYRAEEILPCPRQQTLLVTTEPASIKCYGRAFTSQFGHVLTSQPAWALPHPGRIFSQPALQWFYGRGSKVRTYDQMLASPPLLKSQSISTVCSSKQQRHTLHHQRYHFVQELKKLIPELEVFGHGVRPMADKAESLDAYRYHIAIENFVGMHHWTEKLADSFLGAALPFYHGCPNAADYFPRESFIPIDIADVRGAAEIIRRAMNDGEYEKRLPSILEARRRVLEDYNLFAVLARLIESRHDPALNSASGDKLLSRRLLRKRRPAVALLGLGEKYWVRFRHLVGAHD